jgi:hypothetical protein
VWETTFGLYAQGDEAIKKAVDDTRYDVIVIHAGPTGSTIQDQSQRVLLDELRDSSYSLDRVGEQGDEWLIYTRP